MSKSNNKRILGVLLAVVVCIISAFIIFQVKASSSSSSKESVKLESVSAIDPEDIKALSDFGDNVFVAKVIKEEGTYYENVTGNPDTIYRLKVIENIKGELSTSKPVKIYQHGGLQNDGTLYQLEGEVTLEKGNYYILVTANQGAPSEEEKDIMTMPDGSILAMPGGVVLLDKNEVKALKSDRVQGFTQAVNQPEKDSRLRFPQKDSEVYLSE